MPKLKESIDQAAFDALPETISKSELYATGADGALVLQWEGLGKEKRAHDKTRTQLERAEGRLKKLVPKLAELKPDDWDPEVDAAAEILESATESEFNAEEWRRFKASGEKVDETKLASQLADAQTKIHALTRDLTTVTKERDKLRTEDAAKATELVTKARLGSVNETLDAIGVTAAHERKVARLLFESKGLVHRKVEGKDQFFVKEDGEEIELGDWAKTWAGTDEGKRYVGHPDSSGGGETETPRTTTERVKDSSRTDNGDGKPTPNQGSGRDMLAQVFSKSSGATTPAGRQ